MTNPNLLVQPEWAKWKSTDWDGRMYWWEFRPAADPKNKCWIASRGLRGLIHFAGYADGPQPFWTTLIEEV